jgi:acyl-CoA synthetase (AMP-forming)/AMP-acid ligase II
MLQAQTFSALLRDASARFRSQPFLLDDPMLGTVSYSEVLHFANGLETQFEELGIEVGAPVATLFHNCGVAALLFLATIASRRVLIPLNPLSTAYELEYALNRAQCVAVISDPVHRRCGDFGGRPTIEVTDHREYFAKRCETSTRMNVGPNRYDAEDKFIGEVVFTSGSTGRPKGVVLSERSVLANALALAKVYELRNTDRFLTVCPLFHNSGQIFTTLACVFAGGSTVIAKSDVGMLHFWSYIDKYRPQWAFGMNSFLAMLLAGTEAPNESSFMRGLLTGGSAIDGSVVRQFESRFGVPVRTVYGLTETASISTCEYLDPSPRSLGSSGRPLPICRVRIDSLRNSSTFNDPVAYERGEILINGDNLFERYVGDPDLTRQRKHEGWLYTGDIGYFDEVGNLFVVDRTDSMLIVGGENVYPAEVEKLCTFLPGAAQTVLAGINHTIWGTELVLVYKAKTDAQPSISLWHQILAEKLTAAKLPQRYLAVEDLGLIDFPRRENGKLDRQAIAARLEAWMTTA